jgi:hypothetical protein
MLWIGQRQGVEEEREGVAWPFTPPLAQNVQDLGAIRRLRQQVGRITADEFTGGHAYRRASVEPARRVGHRAVGCEIAPQRIGGVLPRHDGVAAVRGVADIRSDAGRRPVSNQLHQHPLHSRSRRLADELRQVDEQLRFVHGAGRSSIRSAAIISRA